MTEPSTPRDSRLVAGKYEVIGLIGRGGMGSVWEGRHATLGTHVAIKFIDQEYADSREAQSRFVNEARAAATIHSKHAVQIFDHGVAEDGRPYIVMERLVGEPLDRRLDRLGRIPLRETAHILAQVCRALQRAHDAGIIHRDLKPENIFLVRSPDDDDEVAKVLDFGIAKMTAPPGGASPTSSTKTGAVLGTPYFMSPEQARGLRTIDHRSDLWSLGVIAYTCVTGVLPFVGESVGDLLVKICTSPPPVPSLAVSGLPRAFDTWFARALQREPADRFASATDLAESLLLSAGLSARRGLTPNLSDQQTSFGLPLAAAGSPIAATVVTPIPDLGGTSAPFSARASTTRRSEKTGHRVALAIVAAVVGGGLGVGAVMKLLSRSSVESSMTPGEVAPALAAAQDVPPDSGPKPTSPLPAAATSSSRALPAPPAVARSASWPVSASVSHPVSRPPTKTNGASTPPVAATGSATSSAPTKGSATSADPGY